MGLASSLKLLVNRKGINSGIGSSILAPKEYPKSIMTRLPVDVCIKKFSRCRSPIPKI